MLLGCIADDFTGASDLANTLAKAGMRTVLFAGPPPAAPRECEAGVIALKTRSVPPGDAVARSLEALAVLRQAGCRQILFKYCSTFDSTPDGNIGPVADALLEALDTRSAIVCPAFPATGRTVYRGHLFVGDVLLNESGMEKHPLNPMTDANLVRWLGRQTTRKLGRVPASVVAEGAGAVRSALARAEAAGESLLICDALDEADLLALGRAAAGMALVTGGSGIAMGLPENFRRAGLLSPDRRNLSAPAGPAVALSGSCSIATRRQVSRHAAVAPVYTVDAEALAGGRDLTGDVMDWLARQDAPLPLVSSTVDPATLRRGFDSGVSDASAAVETFFAQLAPAVVERGCRRLIVAGGETSSAVVGALDIDALEIGPEIDPGVPALVSDGDRPLALVLKSGNFGADDFFAKALRQLDAMRA